MLFGLPSYAIAGAVSVALTAGAWGWVQTKRVETLQSEKAVLTGSLAACAGRLGDIIKDVESDNAIDRMPDDALLSVPPHWLFPEGDATAD